MHNFRLSSELSYTIYGNISSVINSLFYTYKFVDGKYIQYYSCKTRIRPKNEPNYVGILMCLGSSVDASVQGKIVIENLTL